MEISDDARRALENRVIRILREIDIPDHDKIEIKNELISNYTDASIMKARARCAGMVDKADVESVIEVSEGPDEIASMYMMSYMESTTRAGIVSRSVAFIIDYFLSSICAFILTTPFLLLGAFFVGPPPNPGPIPFMMQYFNLIMMLNLALVFVYFVISEGFYGYTPGKWLLGLKVLRADGRKVGYKETMVRNIPKVFILAVLAEALLMLLNGKNQQRLFDGIAGTIVIRRS
jgi:uncharacterized RDD family membrane protein YckC